MKKGAQMGSSEEDLRARARTRSKSREPAAARGRNRAKTFDGTDVASMGMEDVESGAPSISSAALTAAGNSMGDTPAPVVDGW